MTESKIMAWNEEIKEAAYTSPSGKRQVFIFEAVSRETDLKTAAFTFPEMDGQEIQSLGVGGRRFPFTCIFTGENCLKEADAFEELLKERGTGILEHPVYGQVIVVPTGTIKRSDDLISKLNESTIEITFAETLSTKNLPESSVLEADQIEEALADFDDAAAEELKSLIEGDNITDQLQLKSVADTQKKSISKNMTSFIDSIGEAADSIRQKINDIQATINQLTKKTDTLVNNSASFARAMLKLVRLPSKIVCSAMQKVTGYMTMITSIVNNAKKDPVGINAIKNQFAVTNVAWAGMLAAFSSGVSLTAEEQKGASVPTTGGNDGSSGGGSVSTTATGAMKSRAEVMEVVEQIEEAFASYKEYCDKIVATDSFVDNSDTYEKLLNVVVLSEKLLIENSFRLPTVKIIRLDRDRQIIELLCQLYGADGFNRMDEFINDNDLTADEIVCIPMGREVRYYV